MEEKEKKIDSNCSHFVPESRVDLFFFPIQTLASLSLTPAYSASQKYAFPQRQPAGSGWLSHTTAPAKPMACCPAAGQAWLPKSSSLSKGAEMIIWSRYPISLWCDTHPEGLYVRRGKTCPFDRDGISVVSSFKEFLLYLNYQIVHRALKAGQLLWWKFTCRV